MNLKVTTGDTVELRQENGKRIHVIVCNNGFVVKAPDVGTELEITKYSSFSLSAKTVKAGSG